MLSHQHGGLGAHRCLSRRRRQPAAPQDHSLQDREDVPPPPLHLQEVMDGGADAICCGVVGEGSQFCSKLSRHCAVRDHWQRKKMYDMMDMEDGFYIRGSTVQVPASFFLIERTIGLKFHVTCCFDSRESKSLVTPSPSQWRSTLPPVFTQDPLLCTGINIRPTLGHAASPGECRNIGHFLCFALLGTH